MSGSYRRYFYLNVFLFTWEVSLHKILSAFDLLTSIGMVVSSCMMVYGIKKEKERFLLPAIYYIPVDGLFRYVLQKFNAIDIFCSSYRIIQVTTYMAIFGFRHPVSDIIIIIIIYIVDIIIDFFIWLCVYSHR